MTDAQTETTVDRTVLAVALGLVLLGVGILGGLAYAELTTTLADDYATFQENCGDLDGQTRQVEGGLGRDVVTLNETHVRACRDTSFEEYRRGRHRSMGSTPLNLKQWGLYGGAGLALVLGGGVLLRRERAPS